MCFMPFSGLWDYFLLNASKSEPKFVFKYLKGL